MCIHVENDVSSLPGLNLLRTSVHFPYHLMNSQNRNTSRWQLRVSHHHHVRPYRCRPRSCAAVPRRPSQRWEPTTYLETIADEVRRPSEPKALEANVARGREANGRARGITSR